MRSTWLRVKEMQKYLQDCWFKVSTIYVHESKYYWNTTNSIHLYLDMSACKTCWWVLALKATLSTLLYTRVLQLLDILALSKSQVQWSHDVRLIGDIHDTDVPTICNTRTVQIRAKCKWKMSLWLLDISITLLVTFMEEIFVLFYGS